jgi:multidrug resistance efflux pump
LTCPYEARVEQLEAQLESTKAQVALADAELERAERLVNNENISRSIFDQHFEYQAAQRAFLLPDHQVARISLFRESLNG